MMSKHFVLRYSFKFLSRGQTSLDLAFPIVDQKLWNSLTTEIQNANSVLKSKDCSNKKQIMPTLPEHLGSSLVFWWNPCC